MTMLNNTEGRADNSAKKHEAVMRLFRAWQRVPDLRLGQLIVNARCNEYTGGQLFYIEDFELVGKVETFADRYAQTERTHCPHGCFGVAISPACEIIAGKDREKQ